MVANEQRANRVGTLAACLLLVRLADASPASASGPPPNAKFTHITFEQGLSDQRVQTLLQDRDGFIWFGTSNGLNRYDGYGIVAYRADPEDPSGPSGNLVMDLLEDREGALWVATRSGLSVLDRRTG